MYCCILLYVLPMYRRRLARLYHPDKNPAGRERFQGVQAAYERLQAGAAGGQGPQPWRGVSYKQLTRPTQRS